MIHKIIRRSKIDKIAKFLNPMARLGFKGYSFWLSFVFTILTYTISEIVALYILHNAQSVGAYILFISAGIIIYFAFRDGVVGGVTAVATTVIYYFYIIWSRNYQGSQLTTGINATILSGFAFLFLAFIIGWLKENLDQVILNATEARLQAEESRFRLETILLQLPVGVLMIDRAGAMSVNKKAEEILGRKVPKALRSERDLMFDFTSSVSHKKLLFPDLPLVRALKKGETVSAEEIEYSNPSHEKLILRISAAPIRNQKQTIIAAVSTFYDITDEKKLDQRKDDFINMASHELKTPLTSMRLYADSLLNRFKNPNDARSGKMLEGIRNQTQRLQELVNDLLDVSRIQTGKLSLTITNFKIDELITEAIDLLQPTTTKQQILFVTKKSTMVAADRFRIYQVLTNLISNAIKYSGEGKTIKIRVRRDKKKVIVSVEDSGIGIEKRQLKKVFDRLYQVGDPNEKTFPGLGLGLFISREIIKRHQEEIWVESQKDKGSTFSFTLQAEL